MSAKSNEQEAVRTTIVGGRPPGSGRGNVTVPRGLEVILKKAAVDPDFRQQLFAQRGGVAAEIQLQLDPAEEAMLTAIPDDQLARIINQTSVPVEQRRVFLGRVAGAMLAAIGAGLAGCEPAVQSAGVRPATDGIRPDRPNSAPTNNAAPASRATRGIRPDPPPSAGTATQSQAATPPPGTADVRRESS